MIEQNSDSKDTIRCSQTETPDQSEEKRVDARRWRDIETIHHKEGSACNLIPQVSRHCGCPELIKQRVTMDDLCNNLSGISSNSNTETYEETPSIATETASVHPIKNDNNVDCRQANEEQKPRAIENLFSDISCCCLPTCASDPAAIFSRTWLWFLANSDQFMSSIIVAINLIPEAISYGIMAGLGPRAALQSCWIANMATSLVGGRPGMVSGASGLMALILSRLVQMGVDDGEGGMVSGITFVPYAIGFAGILQSISSLFGMGKLANHLSAPVVVGMVNATALLALALQCRYAKEYAWNDEILAEKASSGHTAAEIEWNIALFQYFGEGFEWITPYLNLGIYSAEVGLSLIICTLLPSVYPGPLFSILVVVAFEFGIARQLGVETPLIRDYGGAQVSIFNDTNAYLMTCTNIIICTILFLFRLSTHLSQYSLMRCTRADFHR